MRRFFQAIKKRGVGGVLRKIASQYLYMSHHSYRFHRSFDDMHGEPGQASGVFDFHVVQDINDPVLRQLHEEFPVASAPLTDYVKNGLILFCLSFEGQVVGYLVIALKDFYDTNHFRTWFRLAPHECYAFALFINPKARKKNSAAILLFESFRWVKLHAQKSGMVCMTDANNKALVRFYRVNGFKMTGRGLDHIRMLGFTTTREVAARVPEKKIGATGPKTQ